MMATPLYWDEMQEFLIQDEYGNDIGIEDNAPIEYIESWNEYQAIINSENDDDIFL